MWAVCSSKPRNILVEGGDKLFVSLPTFKLEDARAAQVIVCDAGIAINIGDVLKRPFLG